MFPKKPRYKRATNYAYSVLEEKGVRDFPLDVKSLIKSYGIKLWKYSKLAKEHNVSVEEVGNSFGSHSGVIIKFSSNEYIIAYNDKSQEERVRFTLAHELGHYILEHLEFNNVTHLKYCAIIALDEDYEILEKETNCFARNLLSPYPLAKLFTDKNVQDIQSFFKLSYSASEVRIKSLDMDKLNWHYCIDIPKYKFFTSITNKYSNMCHCESCGNISYNKKIKFCPVCNNTKIFPIPLNGFDVNKDFGGDFINYPEIPLNKNNRAMECPRCKNSQLTESQDICQVCGIFLINKCCDEHNSPSITYSDYIQHLRDSGCTEKLSGNSRFCTVCGNYSTFFIQNILPPFDKIEK